MPNYQCLRVVCTQLNSLTHVPQQWMLISPPWDLVSAFHIQYKIRKQYKRKKARWRQWHINRKASWFRLSDGPCGSVFKKDDTSWTSLSSLSKKCIWPFDDLDLWPRKQVLPARKWHQVDRSVSIFFWCYGLKNVLALQPPKCNQLLVQLRYRSDKSFTEMGPAVFVFTRAAQRKPH